MEIRLRFTRQKLFHICNTFKAIQANCSNVYFPSTDSYVDNLILEEGSRKDLLLLRYFENISKDRNFFHEQFFPKTKTLQNYSKNGSSNEIAKNVEIEIEGEKIIPNSILNGILFYFTKNGNINGVNAVQLIIEKYNISHYKLHSEYKHYLAEAIWVNGNVEDSLKLFFLTYNNTVIQNQVKVMVKCLFPSLIAKQCEANLFKAMQLLDQFTQQNQDYILLACLWKELFRSPWFSDQQHSKELLQRTPQLLRIIKWLIPNMGKELLYEHKVEDFYRLIEFTLQNELKSFGDILIRLLFDYYYIHQNVERCSAVVKYCSTIDSLLTEEQQRRYINLILKSKNSIISKRNVKNPYTLKFKF